MSATLQTATDCCNLCCDQIIVEAASGGGTGAGALVVETTFDLRLVLAAVRTQNMIVHVLGHLAAFDGFGYDAVWRQADITPDAPVDSVRPNDIANDTLPGRFRQRL